MTYLYGSYLTRDDALGDSDEANVIKPFLRCLINLFQAVILTNWKEFRFLFIGWNADHPECQSLTNTRKEGTYVKVSQWAVNVSKDRLPACIAMSSW